MRPLLERAAHGDARGPQGGADVRGDRARRDQGAVGDGDQSGRVAAARRRRARGARQARSARRLRECARRTTPSMPARMFCCRPPPGARRTAPSPIPSAASRASAPSCRRRARPSRTGGSSREVARRLGFGEAFAYRQRRRHLPRARRALGVRERRRARFRHRRLRAALDDDDRSTRSTRSQWPLPHRRDASASDSASSPTAASSPPTARRASSRPSARAARGDDRRAFRSASTPAACATSGTP